jgi:uncharacterized protein
MDGLDLAILAAVGVVAGTVNTVAGGGSLITLPALILLGMPASLANGTNRVGVLVQSLAATLRFHGDGRLETRRGLALLGPACVGSVLGAWASTQLPDHAFQRIIGVAMVVMLAVIWIRPKRWLEGADVPSKPTPARLLAFFGLGLYGGFLQAGVGVFLLAGLVLIEGLDLVRANGVKVLLVFGFTVPAMAMFLAADLIAWKPALVLAAGSWIGGWLGTRLTLSWGPGFVRIVLLVVVLASAGKLLVG